MTGARGFDLLGPLPEGTTVLEASAGTGKTYAIVGLAARFVAEGGVDLSQLLLVTFSRAATQELRERTRERFGSAAAALADPAAARLSADQLIRHLAEADTDEVTLRRRRLLQALSDFDAATIVTTHSFCQRMLDGLGIAGERDPDTVLVEAADDLTTEVIADLYLRAYSRGRGRAVHSGGGHRGRPGRHLRPAGGARPGRCARAPRPGIGWRSPRRCAPKSSGANVRSGLRDFDDLPMLLHRVLSRSRARRGGLPAGPRTLRRGARRRVPGHRPAAVGHPAPRVPRAARTLVLVGDPKQAIYAFRGAEVLSYLDAVRSPDRHQELTTNWRSDQELLDGARISARRRRARASRDRGAPRRRRETEVAV